MAIEKRSFGRTGHKSTAVIFGGAALWSCSQSDADRAFDLLLKFGINHIDTAPQYGESELRVGPWMNRHRKDFFLATKTMDRDYAAAKASIHRSLERLRTDHVDLLQLHALNDPDEWDQALGAGGALDAATEAREAGLVRHIGVTGHNWNVAGMHRRALERFDFDSVLLPWNWHCANHPAYSQAFESVVRLCEERNVAVQTIKAIARGPWPSKMARRRITWYEPLEAEDDIRIAVSWVLGRPGIFLNSVGDLGLLPMLLRAADQLDEMPSDEAMRAFEERVGLASIFGL